MLRYLLRHFDNEDKRVIVLWKFEPFQINDNYSINLKCGFNSYPSVTIFCVLAISYFLLLYNKSSYN